MHPVLDNMVSHGCHALCNLALMVREDKVHTAAVNIELLAKILASHGSTFTVPTRETVAPGRWPSHNVLGLRTLPQGEIGRVALLVLAVELTCGIEHIIKIAAGENAIFMSLVILGNIEIDRALALIGKSVVENLFDKLNLLYDVTRCMWLDAWRQHIEGIHHLVIVKRVLLHNLHGLNLLKTCLLCNLVLALVGIVLKVADIGDVTHVAHLVAEVLQVAEQHIEGDGGTCMAKMSRAIDSGTAHIKTHIGGIERFEQLFPARERVVYHKSVFHNVIYYILLSHLKLRVALRFCLRRSLSGFCLVISSGFCSLSGALMSQSSCVYSNSARNSREWW